MYTLANIVSLAAHSSFWVDTGMSFIASNFNVLRHVAASSFGALELLYEHPKSQPSPLATAKKSEHIATIRDPIIWIVNKIWLAEKHAREYYLIHGILFITSAATGLFGAYFQQTFATAVSEGAFVLANFVALKYHIALCLSTKNDEIKTSAILGILSNVGYILSHAMLLLGFHPDIALIVCCFAIGATGLQILFDFVRAI